MYTMKIFEKIIIRKKVTFSKKFSQLSLVNTMKYLN